MVLFFSSGFNFYKYVLYEDFGYVVKYIIYIIVMVIFFGISEWREEGFINYVLKKLKIMVN